MKEIHLSQGMVAQVDDENYEQLNQWKWHIDKGGRTFYARHNVQLPQKRISLSMHRFILNAPRNIQVDHIDHNGLNNQRNNLRLCNGTQNCQNRSARLHSSRFKGVVWRENNKKWQSRIKVNGNEKHLGIFTKELDAARAYNHAAINAFGPFADINQI